MSDNENMISNDATNTIASADASIDKVSGTTSSSIDTSINTPTTTSASTGDVKITEEAKEEVEKKFETPYKSDVINKINESPDLITAVESVAAMYCVPSSYIVEDPDTDRISIRKGHVIVPSNTTAKPSENAKAIVQSIGAVLDYISQRVEDKLDKFQADNIRDGIKQDKLKDTIDPSMGNVVATQFDGNGDPVVIYDSGNASLSNTEAAHKTYDEMREAGKVPEPVESTEYSFFSKDEDDITGGIDITTIGSGPETEVAISGAVETNVPAEIKEEGYLVDAIGQRGNTRHLGNEIMQEQGFSFVKPVDFFVESASKKKNKQTNSFGVEHMKFDNTKLLKAIKLINDARKEQNVKRGNLNIEQFINSSSYQKAIDCLNDQFNARLNIRFIKDNGGNREFTAVFNDVKTHLSISKSKGFQLGGLPIDIFVTNTAIDEDAPDDTSLFGQHVVSVLCHEIFHNIMAVLKSNESQFTASLVETMMIAKDVPSASKRRKLISNFVNTMDDFGGLKLNIFTKRAIIKHLTYLSAICHDEKAVREYEKVIKNNKLESFDEQIKKMEKRVRKIKAHTYGPGRYFIPALITIGAGVGMVSAGGAVPAVIFGISFSTLFGTAVSHAIELDTIDKFKNGTIKDYEEHWCDMFAACYNLPVTFFMVGNPRKGAANDYTVDMIKKYNDLEREAMQLMMIKYPTISERNQASVKYAKKVLESKVKLDPAIKKYMEWIVKNYSKTLDIDIDEIYSKGTFDPKTAEDLDKHIESLIGSANINVTESDISWLDDFVDDTEYYY